MSCGHSMQSMYLTNGNRGCDDCDDAAKDRHTCCTLDNTHPAMVRMDWLQAQLAIAVEALEKYVPGHARFDNPASAALKKIRCATDKQCLNCGAKQSSHNYNSWCQNRKTVFWGGK